MSQRKNCWFLLKSENQQSSRNATWKTGADSEEGPFKIKLTFSFSFFSLQWHLCQALPRREGAACACYNVPPAPTPSPHLRPFSAHFHQDAFSLPFCARSPRPHPLWAVGTQPALRSTGPLRPAGVAAGQRPSCQPRGGGAGRGCARSFQSGGDFVFKLLNVFGISPAPKWKKKSGSVGVGKGKGMKEGKKERGEEKAWKKRKEGKEGKRVSKGREVKEKKKRKNKRRERGSERNG